MRKCINDCSCCWSHFKSACCFLWTLITPQPPSENTSGIHLMTVAASSRGKILSGCSAQFKMSSKWKLQKFPVLTQGPPYSMGLWSLAVSSSDYPLRLEGPVPGMAQLPHYRITAYYPNCAPGDPIPMMKYHPNIWAQGSHQPNSICPAPTLSSNKRLWSPWDPLQIFGSGPNFALWLPRLLIMWRRFSLFQQCFYLCLLTPLEKDSVRYPFPSKLSPYLTQGYLSSLPFWH